MIFTLLALSMALAMMIAAIRTAAKDEIRVEHKESELYSDWKKLNR